MTAAGAGAGATYCETAGTGASAGIAGGQATHATDPPQPSASTVPQEATKLHFFFGVH